MQQSTLVQDAPNYCASNALPHSSDPMQFFFCHHMSLMDFVISPPGCGRSVIDFWGWDAHEAQLRRPDEVVGGIWIWSTRSGLNLSSIKLPRPWSPCESSPSRKNPCVRAGNRTRDLMISSQKLWPLDHEACPIQCTVDIAISIYNTQSNTAGNTHDVTSSRTSGSTRSSSLSLSQSVADIIPGKDQTGVKLAD
jgi:hypothetical protein